MSSFAAEFAARINGMTYSTNELPIVVFAIVTALKKFYKFEDTDEADATGGEAGADDVGEKTESEGSVVAESHPPSNYSYGGGDAEALEETAEVQHGPPASTPGALPAAQAEEEEEHASGVESDSFFSAVSMNSDNLAQLHEAPSEPSSTTGDIESLVATLEAMLPKDPPAFFNTMYTTFAKLSIDRSRLLYQYMTATPPEKLIQRQLATLRCEMRGEEAHHMSREDIIAFNKEHIDAVIKERQEYLLQKENTLLNNIFFNYLSLYLGEYITECLAVSPPGPTRGLPEKDEALLLVAHAKGLLDKISESFICPVNTVVEYESARESQYKEYVTKMKRTKGGAKVMYGLEDAAADPSSPLASAEEYIHLMLEEEQVQEMKQSLDPYETALMEQLRPLTASREALGQLVFPFTCPPERVHYGGGHVRLTPFVKKDEVQRVLQWLGATDSDKIVDLTDDMEAEKKRICETLLPADDCPGRETLTLVTKDTCLRTTLTNPLLSESTSGFQCDSCSRTEVKVGFQAVLYENVRNTNCLFVDGCAGFDLCIPCAVFFYKTSVELLLRALHPDPRRRQPMLLRPSDTTHRQMVVWSAKTKAVSETEWRVRLVVGCGLYVAQPVAWEVTEAQMAALHTALATGSTAAEEKAGYVTLTEELLAALPTVPPHWRDRCRRLYRVADGCPTEGASDGDTCAICLESLSSAQLTLRTRCGHWYHVGCLEDIRTGKVADDNHDHDGGAENEEEEEEEGTDDRGDVCPLCRERDYLPKANRPETLRRDNVHYLEVTVPVAAAAREAMVAVGVLLTRDGTYYNPTNLVACQLLRVAPGKLYEEEIKSVS